MKSAIEIAREIMANTEGFKHHSYKIRGGKCDDWPTIKAIVAAIEFDRKQRVRNKIRIIFESVDGQPNPRFVEVEDMNGNSINAGEWSADGDHEALEIDLIALNERLPHETRD